MKVLICTSCQLFSASLCQSINRCVPKAECIEGDSTSVQASLKTHEPDILVWESADSDYPLVLPDICQKFPMVKVLLLLPSGVPDEVKAFCIMSGVAGYMDREDTHVNLCLAIQVIHAGGLWAERLVNALAIHSIFALGKRGRRTTYGKPGNLLSARERGIMVLVASGLRNQEIAKRLYLSNSTVKTHLHHIYCKLGVTCRTKAVHQFTKSH